jgi:hypothetical protein
VAKRRKSLTQGKNLSQGEKILSPRENPSKISLPLVKNSPLSRGETLSPRGKNPSPREKPSRHGKKPSAESKKSLRQGKTSPRGKNPFAKAKILRQ